MNRISVILCISSLILFTNSGYAVSYPGKSGESDFRPVESISITGGAGMANGLRIGSRYQFESNISGELLIGFGLLGSIYNDDSILLSSIVNYYLSPSTKGSTTISLHTGVESVYKSWNDNVEYNFYLSPTLGYEVQYLYGLSLNFRIGLLFITRTGYGMNLDVSAGFRF